VKRILNNILLAALAAGSLQIAGATTLLSGTYTWTGSEAVQSGRMLRDGVVSSWSAPKSYPGQFNLGLDYAFTLFSLNVGANRFVTISGDTTNVSAGFYSAYLGSYDPGNQSLNYLGDAGASPDPGSSASFQVILPMNGTLVFLVNTTEPGQAGQSFRFNIDGINDEVHAFLSVPEPASFLLIASGLIGAGWFRRKRNN
jgi:PEP-CTERM putative exosortase interaction domain